MKRIAWFVFGLVDGLLRAHTSDERRIVVSARFDLLDLKTGDRGIAVQAKSRSSS